MTAFVLLVTLWTAGSVLLAFETGWFLRRLRRMSQR